MVAGTLLIVVASTGERTFEEDDDNFIVLNLLFSDTLGNFSLI